jgi:hypothetical protein
MTPTWNSTDGVSAVRRSVEALRTAQELIAKASEEEDLDQRQAPMLEALRAFHQCDPASFSIPPPAAPWH